MKHKFLIVILYCVINSVSAQEKNEILVDPPFWWVGMKDTTLQLMIHTNEISTSLITTDSKNLKITKTRGGDSKNYLFVDLVIPKNCAPGNYNFELTNPTSQKKIKLSYELKPRNINQTPKGINQSDFVYLVFPDRFSNGNTNNDVVKTMADQSLNRDSMFLRHGGDLQGVINKVDYIKSTGATAVWLNPVQENNQPKESYHGYAITNHYKVDPRFGSNDDYIKLSNTLHQNNLKLIMDIIPNHCGNMHYLIKDLPFENWVHKWSAFTRTSYRAATIMDYHAAEVDKKIFSDAWFDKHMPDLNQKDPYLKKYFIQNCIWWVENAALDGFRIDTYAYPDEDFMIEWLKAIYLEYPSIGVFGEIWDHSVPIQSYFAQKAKNQGINNPPGITDFMLNYAIVDALTKDFGWTEGVSRLYYVLAQDYLYPNASSNAVFLDNHDISRIFSMLNEDVDLLKMALGFLLTTRGIPIMYYGTEILMKNYANPDGKVREDFPGGWVNDKQNKFLKEGRNSYEDEVFNYVSNLANYRKKSVPITQGKLIQFVPENGVYVYSRVYEDKKVLVIMNPSKEKKVINSKRYSEIIGSSKTGREITSNSSFNLIGEWSLEAKKIYIIEIE
jgi:neopullulanase